MNVHKNARLTASGREWMMARVASGQTPQSVTNVGFPSISELQTGPPGAAGSLDQIEVAARYFSIALWIFRAIRASTTAESSMQPWLPISRRDLGKPGRTAI